MLAGPRPHSLALGRRRSPAVFPAVLLTAALVVPIAGCQKVPLLAPTGSTITLIASATALPLGGSTTILVQVIEPAGTPPHQGTHVTFTTSLGSIQPAEVETNINGQATVTFNAGNMSGQATIAAISGGASVSADGAVKIAIGTAAVGRVVVSANPATVSALGGSTIITANVIDLNGNVLSNAPVNFTTTTGTLSQGVVDTDQNGNAQTLLTTSQEATVTASVGAQAPTGGTGTGGTTTTTSQSSGSVTVKVTVAPTLVITAPTTSPSAGLPAAFTFVVTAATTNGTAVRNVSVNWGDGQTQNLGTLTGTQVVWHTYGHSGTFTISATLTDAAGNTVLASTAVVVVARPQPTVSITAPTTTPTAGTDTTFTASVAPAANTGTVIDDVTIDFGDGVRTSLGAVTGTNIALHHVYDTGGKTYTVVLTATDSNGGVGTAVTTVFVQIQTPLAVFLAESKTFSGGNTIESFTATVVGLGNAVVVNYFWVFDPGVTQSTTSNQVTHVYPTSSGGRTVTVTITTSIGTTASTSLSINP